MQQKSRQPLLPWGPSHAVWAGPSPGAMQGTGAGQRMLHVGSPLATEAVADGEVMVLCREQRTGRLGLCLLL